MSNKAPGKTQAKTRAAPAAVHTPQPPVTLPEHEAERPDIAAQLEGAARLGHSMGAVSVDSSPPRIVQGQEIPEEQGEELQRKREPAAIQRQELPEEEEEELMMKREEGRVGPQGGPVPPQVEAAIRRARGGGQPLGGALQEQMSASLGHDFSRVRVHTDTEADELNQQLQAKAFTTGSDIFFRRGEYTPGAAGGRALIAHELTHVVQQGMGRVGGDGSGMTVSPRGAAFEHEAEVQGKGQARPGGFGGQTGIGGKFERGKAAPSGPLAGGRGDPHQVVQRIFTDGNGKYWTEKGNAIEMEDREPEKGANCHGYTYGTWAAARPYNPKQGEGGVGRILKDEAKGRERSGPKKRANGDPSFDQTWPDPPAAGDLIVMEAPIDKYAHSAEVHGASGYKWSEVEVWDKQGYTGAVSRMALNDIKQAVPGAVAKVYHSTPKTIVEPALPEEEPSRVSM